MEELPDYFDVIVVGTGMPECIIAAATARVGKKVLHLDRNGYYGGEWASFSFDKFLEWIEENNNSTADNAAEVNLEALHPFLREQERLSLCPSKWDSISNVTVRSYISDSPNPMVPAQPVSSVDSNSNNETVHEDALETAVTNNVSEMQNEAAIPLSSSLSSEDLTASSSKGVAIDDSSTSSCDNASSAVILEDQDVPMQPEWSLSNFVENRRKFNIDLAPKIMFSRGSLVDLLISSNIARYAEFQCVNKVLTCINNRIEQVPCSRADVFSTKNVTVVEKRMLMKFLTFCLKFEEQEDEYRGFEDRLFTDYLKSKKLTPNVEHFIIHAIAMVDESSNTVQGLKAAQKFLQSLGRYGKSPFLCTCYGSAELPQCFCRLCAVYEGMYYLKRSIDGLIISNRCSGIVSMNQRINSQWLIMESNYAPSEFVPEDLPKKISRAVLITDASLSPSEKKENILLKLPIGPGIVCPVTIFEFSSKTYVCPEDVFLVYMFCRSSSSSAEEDLNSAVNLLFNTDSSDASPSPSEENQKNRPNLLWSLYYNQKDTSTLNLHSCVPEGLFLTSSPDLQLDYEHAVAEAREIFEKICPGEEFLLRAPDPEDILIEMQNNPGDDGETGKIENDVNKIDSGFSEETKIASESEKEASNESNATSLDDASSENLSETKSNTDNVNE